MQKVIDIDNILLASINRKYRVSQAGGKWILTRQYRDMKKLLTMVSKKGRLDPPYRIDIQMQTFIDIDNPVKCIQDSLQAAGIIDDDMNVLQLNVTKQPLPKGQPGRLVVYVGTV